MSVPFYFDHNMPVPVAAALRGCGVDVLMARDDGYDRRPDTDLLERTAELGRVVVSQDYDFLRIVQEWQEAGRSFSGLVFCRLSRGSTGIIIDDLELVARAMSTDEIANTVVWIPF